MPKRLQKGGSCQDPLEKTNGRLKSGFSNPRKPKLSRASEGSEEKLVSCKSEMNNTFDFNVEEQENALGCEITKPFV